jgi:hypothetical protein
MMATTGSSEMLFNLYFPHNHLPGHNTPRNKVNLGEGTKNTENKKTHAYTSSIYLWLYSLLLSPGRFFSFFIFCTVGRTPWTGDQPVQGRYLHTGQHKHWIKAHRHPCLKRDSNPLSSPAQTLGSAPVDHSGPAQDQASQRPEKQEKTAFS